MAITYTWSVVQMDAYPEINGETNVVFTVHWTLSGTDGTYSAGDYGSQSITVDPNASFTPYADLTQDQVIGWVKNAMGAEEVSRYETSIDAQIQNQISPSIVTPTLPWNQS